MPEQRLLFEKTGRAIYISHLDLMRTFQRIFARAGVTVKHSEGFNPRPKISIALPLSLGQESVCEILDFCLVSGSALEELPEKLNAVSPEGIRITKAYDASRKPKEIYWVKILGQMEYDSGAPENIENSLNDFFAQKSIVIKKKSKSGISDFDIVPCINSVGFEKTSHNTVTVNAVITAQNPALNPENLMAALRQLSPDLAPDFTKFRRIEIFDKDGEIFR